MSTFERENRLLEEPIAPIVPEQLNEYGFDTIHARKVLDFDAQKILQELQHPKNKSVLAVDIGGTKMAVADYEIADGKVYTKHLEQFDVLGNGENVLPMLESYGTRAMTNKQAVGISIAGGVEGSRYLGGSNLARFGTQLSVKYDQDLAKVFPTLKAVENDAVTGLIAGALYVNREMDIPKVAYIIVGSGVGGAGLIDGNIFEAEPGHVRVVAALNPFNQTLPCGSHGNTFTCTELVAASKAGIESTWRRIKSESLSGKEISQRLQSGDNDALKLYDNSARVVSHVLIGLRKSLNFEKTVGNEAAIFHGGIFLVPGYVQRLKQYIGTYLSADYPIYFTSDFTENACLDGAAIAAAITD